MTDVQPFWVITATCGDYSDRRWWIVCVVLTPDDAETRLSALRAQCDKFMARRQPIDAQLTAEVKRWHAAWPGLPVSTRFSDEAQEQWRIFQRAHIQALDALIDDLDMMDRKFRWRRQNLETPEYEAVCSSDSPRTAIPDNDDTRSDEYYR
jgi:hypothetical protein